MNGKLNISRLFFGVFLMLGGIMLLSGMATPVGALTISVTTTLDENDGSCTDGDCSLRDAIATAVSGDTISIPSGNYVLTLGELLITKNLTLQGGTPAPQLDGNASARVIQAFGKIILTLTNVDITNGSSADGGGIAVFGAQLLLENSEVRGNYAGNNGGGIYIGNGGLVTLSSGKVSQNGAGIGGGGIYNMNGSVIQAGGAIENNSAGTGGGIYVNLIDASFIMTNGAIQQNSGTAPEAGGGGIYAAMGTVTINGGQISQNSGVRGGGIQSANGKLFLNGGLITENQAEYGGGIYLTFPEAMLTQNGGEISHNNALNADFGGGGVYGFQGSMVLTGGLITQNTAVADGGGLNIRFGSLTISGGAVVENQAGRLGGGIFADQSVLAVANLQLGENSAIDGGGLYLNSLAVLDLSDSAIYSNNATGNGGGAVVKGSVTMTNATLSANLAQLNGGGLWLEGGTAALNNVTVSQNTAVSGGGVFNSSANVTIHNTLLAENIATTGPECAGSLLQSNGYNVVQNTASCTLDGNLSGNILEQAPGLLPRTLVGGSTYIYPLAAGSLAIDAGDPAVCPARDQHNRPRPLDGDLNGTAVCDIGAFEYGIPVRIGNASVVEGNVGSSMAYFDVSLDFSASVTVTVAYATSSQSALAGKDFVSTIGTLSFSPGQTVKTVPVSILGDLLDEEDETFLVTLSSPTNAFLAQAEGVGTIIDNDPLPNLSISDVTIVEGDSGSKTANFLVTLDAPSGKVVQVDYASVDGTATVGFDYAAVSGTLIFAPEQTSKTIGVTVWGDLLDEASEFFTINLTNPQNGTISRSQGVGTIQDNDPLPTLTINNVTVTEGDGTPQSVQFTVRLSAASGKTVTVNYATADQTAVAGRDYAAKSGMLTFAPGETVKTITMTILNDLVAEPTETFSLKLSAPLNAVLSTSQGIGTILDNDTSEPVDSSFTVYMPLISRP